MKLTIGIPCCNNYSETWFTVQSLRMHHDLSNVEILIVDNGEESYTKDYVHHWAHQDVRYVKYEGSTGPAGAKQKVFEEAQGEWVICIDSHVLLASNSIKQFIQWADQNPSCKDLLHGPMLYDNLIMCADAMNDEWRGGMWGTWRNADIDQLPKEPFEIEMHGMGMFACRKDAWLGFNPLFSGFGGEEGYIHTKYRQAGRKVLCLPFLKWSHFFRKDSAPYIVNFTDRINNYLIGFNELGLDTSIINSHFSSISH